MPPLVVEPPAGLRPANPPEENTIIVRVPDAIGDAVLAIPAVVGLAEHFSAHTLLVASHPVVAPLFVGQERVDDVARIGGRGPARLASARRALAGRGPALGVVLPVSLGAAGELAAAGVREIWGYDGAFRRLALDVGLPSRWLEGRHRWEAYGLLAAAVTGAPVAERYPIPIGPGDVAIADELLSDERLANGPPGPLVGLVPGARGSARRWPWDRFSEVASALGRRGARVVLFGTLAGRAETEAIVEATDPQPVDLTGLTPLPVLAECFRRFDAVLTTGSGITHLAAAVGAPLVALYGPDDEHTDGPRGNASAVISHPLFCRPCLARDCAYNHGCMTGIEVPLVVERLSAIAGLQ